MKAKYVNEIKKQLDSNALSTVGIGKSAIFKSYEFFKKHYPNSISQSTVESAISDMKSMINMEKLEEFLLPPYDRYILLKDVSNQFMGDYLENLNGKTSTGYICIDDDRYYIHSFYNSTHNVGFFHYVVVNDTQDMMVSRYYYFVQYKT